MTPELQVILIAAGSAGLIAIAGLILVMYIAQRSPATAALLTPVTVVLAVAGGVGVSAQSMFLSTHDLYVVAYVLLAASPIAIAVGVVLARRTSQLQRQIAQESASRLAEAAIEARRRELVAWVSHDLRTPLAGMRAMSEALEDGLAPDPARYQRQIRENVDRLAVMVDDLLALSRLHAGQLSLDLERIALRDMVSDTLAAADALAAERGIRLSGHCADDVFAVVDEPELSRALTNLVVNAMRYTPPDGAVVIEADHYTDGTRVVVRDSCGGIPEDDLPYVFDPGWRGSAARSPSADFGSGLGLAVVQGIVGAHGGDVTVRNVDGGCCFEIRLPTLVA